MQAVTAMSTLKNILLLLTAVCLVSAVTGVQSANIDIHVTQGSAASSAEVTAHDTYGRLLCLVYAIVLTTFYYGIHRKVLLAWQAGWVVVFSTWLSFIVESLSYSMTLPPPDVWIASIAIVLSGCAGLAYWGVWWKRQKPYFNSSLAR
jgi:hypothetical protein